MLLKEVKLADKHPTLESRKPLASAPTGLECKSLVGGWMALALTAASPALD